MNLTALNTIHMSFMYSSLLDFCNFYFHSQQYWTSFNIEAYTVFCIYIGSKIDNTMRKSGSISFATFFTVYFCCAVYTHSTVSLFSYFLFLFSTAWLFQVLSHFFFFLWICFLKHEIFHFHKLFFSLHI